MRGIAGKITGRIEAEIQAHQVTVLKWRLTLRNRKAGLVVGDVDWFCSRVLEGQSPKAIQARAVEKIRVLHRQPQVWRVLADGGLEHDPRPQVEVRPSEPPRIPVPPFLEVQTR